MVRPVVVVKQGWLRGVETKSELGGSFISFKGIPYAESPVGDLRFKDAQPLEPWTGVRPALEEGPQCVQFEEFSRQIEGDEDCLYLNIATTSLKGSRPVMVWIHGGGFMWGNGGSGIYGPENFMKMDVVFVSFNYRLGIFGFLSLEHEAAPGNIGLKDQVAALKWVKENITQFGGDPYNITIFGESAGGVSVHYHLLSPLSKGLFHKAIAQSGVGFSPFGSVKNSIDFVHRMFAYFDKDITDPKEIVEYLRTVPASELIEAQQKTFTLEAAVLSGFPFLPTIDSMSVEPFLPRPVRELAAEGHDVPFMLGYNSNEGSILTIVGLHDEVFSLVDQNFEVLVSRSLDGLSPSKIPDVTKKIRKFYFGDEHITTNVLDKFVRYIGDFYFIGGIHEVVHTRANTKSPTYLYHFVHAGPVKLSTTLWKLEIEGAGHMDELPYLFYPRLLRDIPFIQPDSTEQVVSDRLLRMWTDFAKKGNPTPLVNDLITAKWQPVTSTTKNYLEIGAELSPGVNPSEEIWQFWKSIKEN